MRKLINTLATLVLITFLSMAGAPAASAVPDTIPLTITNDSGRSEPVYIYVLGERDGRLGYADADGTFHPWPSVGDVPVDAPDASIEGPAVGESITIDLPKLSGRVYFSYDTKIDFKVVQDRRLVQPAVQNPSDPNRDILFNWTEYTLNDAGLWINSTQVDFFSAPYQTGLQRSDGTVISTGMLEPDGFDAVISALAETPGWDDLAQTGPDGTVLRILSPGHAIGTGQLDPDVFAGYVDQVWEKYTSETLTVRPYSYDPDTVFEGRVSGDVMTFTDTSGAVAASFNRPSSDSILGCHQDLAAPNDDVGAIARTLCAGFNRSTLLVNSEQPDADGDAFYQEDVTNHYAKHIHEQMADGKAYAFAFDDVGNHESLVHDGNPAAAYIQLDPFSGAATPIGGGDGTAPEAPLPAGTSPVHADNGMCLDVPWAEAVDGNPVQIAHCTDDNPAQTWTRAGTTLSALGKCLDVAGGETSDGTTVQLWTCNGTGAQQWSYQADDEQLVNPQSGKCLTAVGGAPLEDGQRLEIRTCSGAEEQRWTF